jgi:hypothetical protein
MITVQRAMHLPQRRGALKAKAAAAAAAATATTAASSRAQRGERLGFPNDQLHCSVALITLSLYASQQPPGVARILVEEANMIDASYAMSKSPAGLATAIADSCHANADESMDG